MFIFEVRTKYCIPSWTYCGSKRIFVQDDYGWLISDRLRCIPRSTEEARATAGSLVRALHGLERLYVTRLVFLIEQWDPLPPLETAVV